MCAKILVLLKIALLYGNLHLGISTVLYAVLKNSALDLVYSQVCKLVYILHAFVGVHITCVCIAKFLLYAVMMNVPMVQCLFLHVSMKMMPVLSRNTVHHLFSVYICLV